MTFSEKQQQTSNPAPPSLSAGGHEMRDYYAAQDASRPLLQQEPYLTPYLGLRARLSQTWINRWTVLLLLVLIRTLLAVASLDDDLGSARKQALSACTSVENVGSAMASMPHYMAQGTNKLTIHGIEKAINGLMEMLILTLTGVEEIVLFIINLLTSTYVCLITFAVSGSLHVAVTVAKDVGDFLNSTVQDVGKDLGDAAGAFQTTLNGFLSDVDKIGNALTGGSNSKPPSIDLTSEINKLDSLQLPTDYQQGLDKLNASIPTFDQVHNFTDSLISLPFEELKKLLNESLPKYTLNLSLFPVPAKEQLTFCSDNNGIGDFFDDLVRIERLAKKIFLVVIIILAILAMVPMAYRELRRWRFVQRRAAIVKTHPDSLDAVYLVERPYTSSAGLWISEKVSSSPRRQALVRWSVAYATTVPALFVLSLAVAGLLGCLCQYILLKAIEKEVPVLTNEIIDFTDRVIDKMNNASEAWAVGSNKVITDMNQTINQDVLGWVGTSTTAVNQTLNAFVDGMTGVLNDTFGKTVLYDPIMEVLNCLVLLKIKGIEDGLTWVHDHAHVNFPLTPIDTFNLKTIAQDSGSNILSTNGGAGDEITSIVDHVVNAIAKAIRQEAIISTCVLLVWVLIALIGIVRAVVLGMRGGANGTNIVPHVDPNNPPVVNEKAEWLDLPSHPAPAYDQTVKVPIANVRSGDKLNGLSYTLTPNPLPRFHGNAVTSPILNTGFKSNEKLGVVNGQHVDAATRRQTHLRASSYGDYDNASPNSPPPPPLPLSSTRRQFQSMDKR